jgi:hypothetical protein
MAASRVVAKTNREQLHSPDIMAMIAGCMTAVEVTSSMKGMKCSLSPWLDSDFGGPTSRC